MDMWLVFVLPSTPRLARSVTKNVTVRTVYRDVRPMFMISYLYLGSLCWKIESSSMRSPTPRLARSVDEEFLSEDSLHGHVADVHTAIHRHHACEKCDKKLYSEDYLQRHRADVHDQCEKHTEAEFDMEEEFNTDSAYIPCLCQLRIENKDTGKNMIMLSTT